MLKGGAKGAESVELKKIRKYARTGGLLYSLSILTRIGGIGQLSCHFTNEKCETRNQIAPCKNEPFWYLMILYWGVAYGICYAQQPGKKKYTTRAYEAVKSTFRSSRSSKSRGSTNKTGGSAASSGGSSGASSGKSGGSSKGSGWSNFLSGGSSKNSSTNSSSGSDSSVASEGSIGSDVLSGASSMGSELGSEFQDASAFEQGDEEETVVAPYSAPSGNKVTPA
ncbi:hypothetical protein ScalyP_jg4940 [Parmales sp. scaly parma]|nr:hypothetical protein ScalyP_jg4940 [Parmales sp. scaly parma]